MADIMSSIPIVSGLGGVDWAYYAWWIFAIFAVVASIMALFFTLLWKKRQIKVYEIEGNSHRICELSLRKIRDKENNTEKMWFSKYKKYIQNIQQQDYYYKKNKDALLLYKDVNGLHHPLRLLSKQEIIDFYKKVKGIDIEQSHIEKEITQNGKQIKVKMENPYYRIYQIYAMPNPHEDLEWLSKECVDSNKEFKTVTAWYLSPTVMVIGTAFICFMMIVVTLLFRNRG